jgi:imidazolonepropionase-like amidohydrolase
MILTTGTPLVPENGTPYYLKPKRLPEAKDPQEAERLVAERLTEGTDAIKIFSGSWVAKDKVVPMPVEIVKAVTAAAHRSGLLVFAHPSDTSGLTAALEGGVDILAHSEEVPGSIDPATMAKMIARGMALIPTLKLFSRDDTLPNILQQVKAYADLGGRILFGTDVGYLTDYDPTAEYQLLSKAGLTFSQILASLTTAPATRFGFGLRKGRLAPGMDADIVLLGGDPAAAVTSFTDVRYSIRSGAVRYSRPKALP